MKLKCLLLWFERYLASSTASLDFFDLVHLQRGARNFPKRLLWLGGSSGLTDFRPSTPIGGFAIAPDLV